MDWLEEIWNQVKSIVITACSSLDDLVINIDNVKFDSTNTLYKFLGMVRYVIGDNMYNLLCILMYVGLLVTLYKLIIIVINIISNLIPGLKGKIVIR